MPPDPNAQEIEQSQHQSDNRNEETMSISDETGQPRAENESPLYTSRATNTRRLPSFRQWLEVTVQIVQIVALGSIVLLWHQNVLIRQDIEQQAEISHEQIAQQSQIWNVTQRAELIATMYDQKECSQQHINDCPPRASIRARVEAAVAFIEFERAGNSDSRSNLTRSYLKNGWIWLNARKGAKPWTSRTNNGQ